MFNHAVSEGYIRRNYAHGCTKELGIYNNKREALTQAQQAEFELYEEGIRRFQICPPKTIKGIRKIPLTAKAMHALKKQKVYMLKHGMLENFMVDSHSGFVFLTKRFQLWSATKLDIILHRIVYDYNSIEVANAIIEGTFPDFL